MTVIGSNALAGASGQGGGGYEIERSLRITAADAPSLVGSVTTEGSRTTFTLSLWLKRSGSSGSSTEMFFMTATSGYPWAYFYNDNLQFDSNVGSFITEKVFRDPSAWYHVVIAVDTTNATAADRAIIYVNGERQILSASPTIPQNNQLTINNVGNGVKLGTYGGSYVYDGYMADIYFVDGQALTPTDFGEYDNNNVWQPKKYDGTYGTNGFHLDFSDNSSNSALGTDSSGNGNNFTVSNLIVGVAAVNYSSMVTEVYSSAVGNAFSNSTPSTGAVIGSWGTGSGTCTFTPTGGIAVNSSLVVYYGAFNNTATATVLTITYTDSTTETNTFTSGYNNWMTSFTANNAAGKTIQSISVVASAYQQFGGFVIDGTALLNSDAVIGDDLRDSPTNGDPTNDTGAGGELSGNYATWNPLTLPNSTSTTVSNANLVANTPQNGYGWVASTLPLKSGKYYCEITFEGTMYHTTNFNYIGIVPASTVGNYRDLDIFRGLGALAIESDGTSKIRASLGTGGSETQSDWNTSIKFDETSTIGIAIDCDTPQVKFYVDGVDVGTYPYAMRPNESWVVFINDWAAGYPDFEKYILNAGQSQFNYAAPSGYKAMCTANLPDPTIADPSTAFDAKLYVGNGSTQTISGYGFSPDLVWTKGRDRASSHNLFDTVRGATKLMYPDATDAESTISDSLTAFTSDGFSLGSNSVSNHNAINHVAWAWDAGSSNTTVTSGSLNSQVYNTSQTWSTYGTFDNNYSSSSYHWPGVFNTGNYYTSFQCLYVNSSSVYDTWTLTSPISVSSSVEVRVSGGATIKINGGLSDETIATSTGNNHHHLNIPFTGNLSSIGVVGSTYLCAVYVDGKQLVDPNLTSNFNGAPGITSTIRANPSAGISIVSFTGTATSNTIAHGLNAGPEFAIFKSRDSTKNWRIYHKDVGTRSRVDLNTADPISSASYSYWQETAPDSTFMYIGENTSVNTSGENMIALLFTGVDGFSKFGSYTGNASSNGPFVYTGFKPKVIFWKDVTNTQNWGVIDTERDPDNAVFLRLTPNSNDVEWNFFGANYPIDILSNGFKIRNSYGADNAAGDIYVYAAWAENPFKTARAH